jgi:hypothetical protein
MMLAFHKDSPEGNIVFFIAFVVMVIAAVISAFRQKRASRSRSLEFCALAQRLKFDSFNPERDDDFPLGWGFLNHLSQGTNRYAFNILRGTYHDQQLFVFDYHYETGSGRNKRDFNLTIFMLIEKEAFPQITIGRENIGERIVAAFGIGDEVKLESAEFSRTFCVRSKDKKFAYDVCNGQMMEYLLANRDLEIEIQGPVISLAFEPQLPVDQIEFNLQRLAQIRSLMPDYLFTQNA